MMVTAKRPSHLELGRHEQVVLPEGGHSLVLVGHLHLHRVLQRCPLQLRHLGSDNICENMSQMSCHSYGEKGGGGGRGRGGGEEEERGKRQRERERAEKYKQGQKDRHTGEQTNAKSSSTQGYTVTTVHDTHDVFTFFLITL